MNRRSFFGRLAAAAGLIAVSKPAESGVVVLKPGRSLVVSLPPPNWVARCYSQDGRLVHMTTTPDRRTVRHVVHVARDFSIRDDFDRISVRSSYDRVEFECVGEVNSFTLRYRQISGPRLKCWLRINGVCCDHRECQA